MDSHAVNNIGPDAFSLLVAVVLTEDELHYKRAPNFFNAQLMKRCGIGSEPALIRARKRAISAGLLIYTPGAKRRPAFYFVVGDDFPNESLVKAEGIRRESGGKAEGIRQESVEKAPQSVCPPYPIPNTRTQTRTASTTSMVRKGVQGKTNSPDSAISGDAVAGIQPLASLCHEVADLITSGDRRELEPHEWQSICEAIHVGLLVVGEITVRNWITSAKTKEQIVPGYFVKAAIVAAEVGGKDYDQIKQGHPSIQYKPVSTTLLLKTKPISMNEFERCRSDLIANHGMRCSTDEELASAILDRHPGRPFSAEVVRMLEGIPA